MTSSWENLSRIDRTSVAIEVRNPVIPWINDGRENIEALARISGRLRNLAGVQLLPDHELGKAKHARLGRSCPLSGLQPPSEERMEEISSFSTSKNPIFEKAPHPFTEPASRPRMKYRPKMM